MDTTQAELDQAKKDQRIQAEASSLEIERLEAKLAEEQKPKLRHGDYGKCYSQEWMHIYGQTYWMGKEVPAKDRMSSLPDSHFIKKSKQIYNRNDDLAAMQEDVEDGKLHEFVTDTDGNTVNLTVQVKEHNNAVWLWSSEGRGIQLKIGKLTGLISLLKRAEATLKRQAK